MKKTILTNLTGVDIKAKIEEAVKRGISVYEEECKRQTGFKEPIIGYANTSEPIFDMFYDNNLCKLPRKVYNPARAVIVYFLPYTDDITKSNIETREPSEKWVQAYHDSTWAIMKVNASICEEIAKFGRLASICNTPVDWNEKRFGPEWNFRMAAYAAKLGEFGPNGCVLTKAGYAGRFGAVLTDINLVPENDYGFSNTDSRGNTLELRRVYENYLSNSCYEGDFDNELIELCPGNAITEAGINRKACQEYCKTIFKYVPTPEVCGKCFRYHKPQQSR